MAHGFNWDDARVFLALARAGTLVAAAQRLKSGVATVSRRIDRLERALGSPLFLRHQSGYRLTDQGQELLARAEVVEQAMQGFSAEAATQQEVSGSVRLATIESLVAPIIVPALAPLLVEYPGLDVDVRHGTTTVNLHRRDADLALRLVLPERGHLTVRHVATIGFGLYAPPREPLPTRHVTWPDQDALQPVLQWSRAFAADAAPRLAVDTLAGQVEAVARGVGLAILPHFLARTRGLRLVEDRLPDGRPMSRPVYLVIHADLAATRRIRAVAECLTDALTAHRSGLADP